MEEVKDDEEDEEAKERGMGSGEWAIAVALSR